MEADDQNPTRPLKHHQPPRKLDITPPHDPCGPRNDGEPKNDDERLGKRVEAWTVRGKG
ncbi:hypothetical protein A2U01_0009154 [Trifolium medium]|uniref:Uncharacterized protein n=1 Tax=Trifolium medium TaxID=97028 RepID=A0A392MLA2_9FABA|nr:hypothetical protein [Trifolium medium]